MSEEEKVIRSLADSNKALTDSYDQLAGGLAEAAMQSKAWNIVSRMTSGSGFWKVQNKFRAVAESITLYNKNIKESIETQSKAAKTMKQLKEAQENLPKFDEESQTYDIEAMRKLPEYEDQIEIYQKVYGEDADEALIGVLTEQLDANRELIGGLEGKMVEQLRYDKAGPVGKFAMKMLKIASLIKNVFKMMLRFLIGASVMLIGFILLIPLAVKVFKLISKHISMEDIKKVLGVVKKVIMFIFDVLKAAFSGNYGELFGLVYDKVISPLISWLGEKIGNIVTRIREAGTDLKDRLIEAFMTSGPVQLFLRLADMLMNSPLVKGVTGAVKGVRSFLGLSTGGTINRGGMAIVGENGPELVSLPSGATVHSNSQSKGMGNTIHVHVNGRVGASDAEIRDIAQKVAREINLQMNRTTSAVGRF